MTRPSLIERLAARQRERAEQALTRRLRRVMRADHTRVEIGGRSLINFAGNDYLGLAGHPALRAALIETAARWGVGATASQLLGGHRAPHAELEAALAEWTGRERALLFSTGVMANFGVLGALLGEGELCVQDKLNHASLLDGARACGAELRRYPHADVEAARRQLEVRPDTAALLVTDGVFSMDGDVAPIAALADLARDSGASLMIDDAHGIGVLGPEGAGSVREAGLDAAAVPIYMATLGKALGSFGAFVAGDEGLIEGLAQFARTHVYTTAMPPALAAAALAGVRVARFEPWRRDKLALLVAHFRHGATRRGLPLAASRTPIQPVLIGDTVRAIAVSEAIEVDGFFLPAIRPPTVPDGSARLRVSLCALHHEHEVEALLDAIARAMAQTDTAKPEGAANDTAPRSRPAARAPRSHRSRSTPR